MIRVSDVLSYHPAPHLVAWERKKGWEFCQKVREESLKVGTIVDKLVQDDINGQHPVGHGDKEIMNCIKAWENFKASPEGAEFYTKAVRHKANMQRELVMEDLMGHPDFIFDDELPDLKTSKSISIAHWMQVAQYAKMYNDGQIFIDCEPEKIIKRISILRLDKYDEQGVYEYKTLEEPFITSLQEMFQVRYEGMVNDILRRQDYGKDLYEREETLFAEMMRKKLEEERLA